VVFALLLVAGFESSAWVGGIAFPLAAPVIVVAAVIGCAPGNRVRFILGFGGAGLLAIAIASPLLYDQFTTTAMRGGSPVGFEPFEVLGFDLPDGINGIVDLAAYWAVFLVNEFPAFYLTGGVMLVVLFKGRRLDDASKQIVVAFGLLTLVSLCVGWLLVSSGLGNNNDLGWRGVLPAVMVLIVFAAIALMRLTSKPLSLAALAAFALVAFGLPEAATLIKGNIKGATSPSAKAFAATPALWDAVRRNSDKSDRVANNPLFMEHVTPWPINISWALLSDRRSCFAGSDYAPFMALPKQRVDEIAAQFARVFDGKAGSDDIGELANRYNCNVVVITPEDGAWKNDPFAAGPLYRLAEKNAAWRIYKSVNLRMR
jgi:hypothetical protein